MTNARKIIAGHIRWYTLGGDADVREADAIIAALAAAGLVIVPKEPTEKMKIAGHAKRYPFASDVWRAMLEAATDE